MVGSVTAMETANEKKTQRDWFGYILTGFVGLLVTVGATWYQLSATEREANAADIERSRAVRQSVIMIVEEQVLNGIKLEWTRISRLIDQRRREQKVSLQISTADVVEQAEFNIASSTHLSVERKDQIKTIFDSLYAEVATRNFQTFADGEPNAALLNELAKQIQEGKTGPALANVRKLHERHLTSLDQLSRKDKPGFFDALQRFLSSPINFLVLAVVYVFLYRVIVIFYDIKRKRAMYGRSVL
ncbi:hypothetical protein [Acidovorax radicis]|uniref:hypothetical protein n=1 Tax=Acidovorax radicis TaxID=758826 RepID=UPI0011118F3F|nr:hypothetical protein [Acidovorax radicis]